jgi:hypothetical protein
LGIQVLPLRSINEDEEDITSLFGELPVEERQSRAVR